MKNDKFEPLETILSQPRLLAKPRDTMTIGHSAADPVDRRHRVVLFVLLTIAFALTQKVDQLWNFAQAGMMGVAFYAMFFTVNRLGLPAGPIAAGLAVTVLPRGRWNWGRLGTACTQLRRPHLLHLHPDLRRAHRLRPDVPVRYRARNPLPSILSPVRIVGGIAVSDWDLPLSRRRSCSSRCTGGFLRHPRRPVPDRGGGQCQAGGDVRDFSSAPIASRRHRGGVPDRRDLPARRAHWYHAQLPMVLILTAVIGTLLGGMGRVFVAEPPRSSWR